MDGREGKEGSAIIGYWIYTEQSVLNVLVGVYLCFQVRFTQETEIISIKDFQSIGPLGRCFR